MAFDRVFVLFFARDFVLAGHQIRRLTHGQSGRGFLDSGSQRGKKRWTKFCEKLEFLLGGFRAGEILEVVGACWLKIARTELMDSTPPAIPIRSGPTGSCP